MCVHSQSFPQYIPVINLWERLHSGIFNDEVFGVVMIHGYIDESYEGVKVPDIFTLSCSLAYGADWAFIEAAWLWVIAKKNEELVREGKKPIKRYHAVDCFNRQEDFEGWDREKERDPFVEKLFRVFEMFPTSHITLSMSAKDIAEIWPENDEQPLHFAYNLLIRFLMLEIGRNRTLLGLRGNISLVYERSDYGESMLKGFNRMMDDPTFVYRDIFTTLAPMGWEKCVPLQPADLVAYEVFRDMKRRTKGKPMNRSLRALVEKDNFRLLSKHLNRENVIELREMHDRTIRKAL